MAPTSAFCLSCNDSGSAVSVKTRAWPLTAAVLAASTHLRLKRHRLPGKIGVHGRHRNLEAGRGVAGFIAFVWRVVDEFGSHLRISLKVEAPKDGWATALTTVENKGNRSKDILYACLLVGPDAESPIETARTIAALCGYQGMLDYTNDLGTFRVEKPELHGDRALIPLPFYYSENVDIADKTLSYRVPIAVDSLTPGTAYAVRFFLFANARLHRSTHDCFIKPATALAPPTSNEPARS